MSFASDQQRNQGRDAESESTPDDAQHKRINPSNMQTHRLFDRAQYRKLSHTVCLKNTHTRSSVAICPPPPTAALLVAQPTAASHAPPHTAHTPSTPLLPLLLLPSLQLPLMVALPVVLPLAVCMLRDALGNDDNDGDEALVKEDGVDAEATVERCSGMRLTRPTNCCECIE